LNTRSFSHWSQSLSLRWFERSARRLEKRIAASIVLCRKPSHQSARKRPCFAQGLFCFVSAPSWLAYSQGGTSSDYLKGILSIIRSPLVLFFYNGGATWKRYKANGYLYRAQEIHRSPHTKSGSWSFAGGSQRRKSALSLVKRNGSKTGKPIGKNSLASESGFGVGSAKCQSILGAGSDLSNKSALYMFLGSVMQ
jgi:hypothetical protein